MQELDSYIVRLTIKNIIILFTHAMHSGILLPTAQEHNIHIKRRIILGPAIY